MKKVCTLGAENVHKSNIILCGGKMKESPRSVMRQESFCSSAYYTMLLVPQP